MLCDFSEREERRPSVCLSSVTFVHSTQAIEIFGNVSMPFNTFAICWHPGKNFTAIVLEEPLRRRS